MTAEKQIVKKEATCERVEINEQNPSILLVVYGTLRLNQGNWNHFLKNKSTYVGTFKTEPKYTMYGLKSGFPIVVPNGETSITCDVFSVNNPRVVASIHGLEGFRGCIGDASNWYDCQPIDTPFGKGYIYIQPNFTADRGHIIKNGDWLRRNFQ